MDENREKSAKFSDSDAVASYEPLPFDNSADFEALRRFDELILSQT